MRGVLYRMRRYRVQTMLATPGFDWIGTNKNARHWAWHLMLVKARPSERHLHARWQLHASGHAVHFVLAVGFDLAHGVVDGRGEQRFKHFQVIFAGAWQYAWVDAHALDVVTTGHHHTDHIATGFTGDFGVGQFFLHLGHFFLHLLCLLHQAGHATFHHGNSPRRSIRSFMQRHQGAT